MDETDNKTEEKSIGLNLVDDPNTNVPDMGEVEKLRHEVQTMKVEAGRVSALQKRNNEQQEEINRLKAENENLSRQNRDYMGMLPEEMRNQVDAEQLQASGMLMDKMIAEQRRQDAERQKQDAELRQKQIEMMNRSRNEDFLHRIDEAFPGFLNDTSHGGSNEKPWVEFQKVYGPSIRAALHSYDFDSFSQIVKLFYSQALGVQTRGVTSTITPAPANVGNSGENFSGKDRYTYDQYASIISKAGDDKRSGNITTVEYKKILAEMNKALGEGRVEPPVYQV